MADTLNRSLAPAASSFKHIPLPNYKELSLSNGIPVYLLPYGTVEVIEVQAVFQGGTNYQHKGGLATFCMQNMVEATQSHDSLSLAQTLDGYGAWLSQRVGEEGLSVSLATLSKNLSHTLHLLREVVTEPAFSEHEFQNMRTRTLQKMHVAEQKTSNRANRAFRRRMFRGKHPYGSTFGSEELNKLTLAELKSYFESYILTGNLSLLVTGKFDQDVCLNLLEKEFGHLVIEGNSPQTAILPEVEAELGRHIIEQEGLQSSIRLGHRGIPRNHTDYYGMQVVNTILGGYFGSRLMHNIREEKGYTYGIYSGWLGLAHGGFFIVQADVGNEYAEATISEVKKEMTLLSEKGVSDSELDLVKNYMLGQGISQRETPFQLGDLLRFSLLQGISFEEIDRKFEVISKISAKEIQELAQKYLKPDQMLEVIVGMPT